MQEKSIPFKLDTEVPWDSTTRTTQYNPLGKVPVLVSEDGKTAVYESHFIMEWLEAKYPQHPLLPPTSQIDDLLFAKQIEVVADGMCDALILSFFESQREPEKRSQPWTDRQQKKVEGGLKALSQWVDQKKGQYLVGDQFGLADIAVGSVLGFMAVRAADHPWRSQYPALKHYWESLEERQSFKDTVPRAQAFKDQIV